MSEEQFARFKAELSILIDIKNQELFEKIKTIVVSTGILRDSVSEMATTKTRSTGRVLKGDEVPMEPISRIQIKDINKVKGSLDFLQHVVKTAIGEKFFEGILKALDVAADSEEMKKHDQPKTQKTTRMVSKVKHLWESYMEKSEEHSLEVKAIFDTYKANCAKNVMILPTVYYIGCNQAMLDELNDGIANGVNYAAEPEIIPDVKEAETSVVEAPPKVEVNTTTTTAAKPELKLEVAPAKPPIVLKFPSKTPEVVVAVSAPVVETPPAEVAKPALNKTLVLNVAEPVVVAATPEPVKVEPPKLVLGSGGLKLGALVKPVVVVAAPAPAPVVVAAPAPVVEAAKPQLKLGALNLAKTPEVAANTSITMVLKKEPEAPNITQMTAAAASMGINIDSVAAAVEPAVVAPIEPVAAPAPSLAAAKLMSLIKPKK